MANLLTPASYQFANGDTGLSIRTKLNLEATDVANAVNILVAHDSTGHVNFAGPTVDRIYTLPDANATLLTSANLITVPQGGTGVATLTNHGVLLGQGASPIVALAAAATGTVLHGNTGADPSFSAIDLTADVTNILPGANGGTGNGFFAVAGPAASLKTFTFPNANATVLTTNALVTVAQGGTGLGTLTIHALYVGNGTTAPNAVGVGATGTVLRGQTGADPVFGAVVLTTDVTGTLPMGNGGLGVTTLTNHGVLLGQGGSSPVAVAVMTDGQLLVGQSAADPLPKTISGAFTLSAAGVALGKQHTRQVFLSGAAATYTTPAGCTQIVVRMVGGGGGGGGSGTTAPGTGSTGSTTIFNSINANGGAAGSTVGQGRGGAGGTGGTGSASVRIPGSVASNPSLDFASATTAYTIGGSGGGRGGGPGGEIAAGTAGIANSGGGGGGAGFAVSVFATIGSAFNAGYGGGEGEYVEIIQNSPAATYVYTVGAGGGGGAAGAGGLAGAAGGSGYIIVDEYY